MLWRPLVSNTSSAWSLMSRIQSGHKLSLILSSTPNSPPLTTWASQCLSSIQGLLPWALISSPQILRDLRYIPPHLAPATGGSTKNWSESHALRLPLQFPLAILSKARPGAPLLGMEKSLISRRERVVIRSCIRISYSIVQWSSGIPDIPSNRLLEMEFTNSSRQSLVHFTEHKIG